MVLFVVFLVLALLGIGAWSTTGTRVQAGVFARFPLMLSVAAMRPLFAFTHVLRVLGGLPSPVTHG